MKKILFLLLMTGVASVLAAQVSGLYGTKGEVINSSVSPLPPLSAGASTVLLEENMDDVTTLEPSGWVFNNVDGGGSTDYFQGNTGVFDSYNGAPMSYCGQNYNGANGYLIDQWLISPEIESYGETIFSFWAMYTGSMWLDHIYIYYSPTGSDQIGDFELLMDRTALTNVWTQYTESVSAYGPVRFAIRYHETDGGLWGDDSDYWGLDAVQVMGNPVKPVPVSIWWIAGIFFLMGTVIMLRKFIR
ncbi:MAG: choice-of-anchor J domain-containing protein [Prolixibacteraceae bacterium]|jgi:hypothetical protein|nr:choice-of-anchor J domain-containing protein [Prolixibacteraceae bacterium]